MAQLAGAGLTAEQLALVMELSAAVATEARPTVDRAAENKRAYDRQYQQERRNSRKKSYDANDPPNEYISNPPPVSDETGLAAQPKSGSKRGTRLAEDFEAPADWIDWAVKRKGWSRAEAVEEAECFARYWQAKPGREACKLDWPKTWQNWVMNSRRAAAGKGSTGPPGSGFYQHYKRQQERMATG